MKKILITGVAGFIGYHLAVFYLNKGYYVVGIDNINDYYDTKLKNDRLENLYEYANFTFYKGDISDKEFLKSSFSDHNFDCVINLAAQAGVRYSLLNPDAYIQSNIVGFHNIIELVKELNVKKFLYASSSSVYGGNTKVPFSEDDNVDKPVSLYAATKKSNELIAQTYSHLYGIKSYGLRFFTVYGPYGRPDMAYFNFVDKYFNNEHISIFNNGDFTNDLYRDFTYIDDIVKGIYDLSNSEIDSNHEVYNIGNSSPTKLMDFIDTLEKSLTNSLGKKVEFTKKYEPIKPGDVPATHANTDKLFEQVGFRPSTPLEVGLNKFTEWYVNYYEKK